MFQNNTLKSDQQNIVTVSSKNDCFGCKLRAFFSQKMHKKCLYLGTGHNRAYEGKDQGYYGWPQLADGRYRGGRNRGILLLKQNIYIDENLLFWSTNKHKLPYWGSIIIKMFNALRKTILIYLIRTKTRGFCYVQISAMQIVYRQHI